MSRENILLVVLGAVAVGAGVFFYKRASISIDEETVRSTVKEAKEAIAAIWEVPRNGLKYMPAIRVAAETHGVPVLLLARLLYQESRFRDDVVTGKVISPSGAVGIAQFMPATARELGVDPLNPYASIDGAARYLRRLYDKLGSWERALAAYNWGIGNVTRKGLSALPNETRTYVAEILKDIGL